ncbi:Chemotaxis protein methyltransferase [Thiorhodovibrio frisius]|nr:Chemotaxis protein methyltransferase [Thiorhodovibrio frisius]
MRALLQGLPTASGIAYVLVPHLDPHRASLLPELLKAFTTMPVAEIGPHSPLTANCVSIGPSNFAVTLSGGRLRLHPAADVATLRQGGGDAFLCTLAHGYRERAIGVILSGTGIHGIDGLKAIKAAGGLALAQTPNSAACEQMPQSVLDAGLVDALLPPQLMGEAIQSYVTNLHSVLQPALAFSHPTNSPPTTTDVDLEVEEALLDEVLLTLHKQIHCDFSGYRRNMVWRRVKRRMGLCRINRSADYLDYLRAHPEEARELFQDLLIGVTRFFRDAKAFAALQQALFAPGASSLLEARSIRVWVPGCATGEEAYSLAILLLEQSAHMRVAPSLQIFATDIDPGALKSARRGVYPDSIATDLGANLGANLGAERLGRFFVREGKNSLRVTKQVREVVLFACQNLIADPPFSNLDLISCRNLLIYFKPKVQQQILGLFHFALKPNATLLLGPAETIGRATDLFETLSKPWRLFRRIGPTRHENLRFPITADPAQRTSDQPSKPMPTSGPTLEELARTLLMEQFVPASVLVNRQLEILYFFGPTDDYLIRPNGPPSLDLITMTRQSLRARLRGACLRALSENSDQRLEDLHPQDSGPPRPIDIRIRALRNPAAARGLLLISFLDQPPLEPAPAVADASTADDAQRQRLERELQIAREDLQNTAEGMEHNNEELMAANEEAMAMNEELQSANEELVSSKEELQSLNEELSTVNSQLEEKIRELETSGNDLHNLISSAEIATVFLDTAMHIKSFTPNSARLLNLRSGDEQRPLSDLAPNIDDPRLLEDAQRVLDTLTPSEREIAGDLDTRYLRRILPYRTRDNRIDGVTINFIDISARAEAEAAIRQSEARYRILFDDSPMCLMELDCSELKGYLESLRTSINQPIGEPLRTQAGCLDACYQRIHPVAVNRATMALVRVNSLQELTTGLPHLFPIQSPDQLADLIESLLATPEQIIHEGVLHDNEKREIPVLCVLVPAPGAETSLARVLVALIDISDRKAIETELRHREERLDAVVSSSTHGILVVDQAQRLRELNPAAMELFGVDQTTMLGQPLERLILPDDKVASPNLFKTGISAVPCDGEWPHGCIGVHANGTHFPLELSISAIGHLELYVLWVRDQRQRLRLEREVIEASTREQERIGRDIHDGLGQQLTGISLLAARLATGLARTKQDDANLAAALSEHIQQALADTRVVVKGLAPVEIVADGLPKALAALAERIDATSPELSCQFSGDIEFSGADQHAVAHLFRIAQEAVHNAVKHGKPKQIDIRLEETEHRMVLSIRDDGYWKPPAATETGQFGLHIMRYRASIIGGLLDIQIGTQGEQHGTLVRCVCPRNSD